MSNEETKPNISTLLQQYEELVRLREQLLKFEAIIKDESIFNAPKKKQREPDDRSS